MCAYATYVICDYNETNQERYMPFLESVSIRRGIEGTGRGILNDRQIRALGDLGVITPFQPKAVRRVDKEAVGDQLGSVISFGTSSFGYDVRLAAEGLKCFHNQPVDVTPDSEKSKPKHWQDTKVIYEIDPKRFDSRVLWDMAIKTDQDGAKYVSLPGYSYMLGHTMEWFELPSNLLIACLGKSTYARTAISVNVTPIEPGFKGNVVIEIINHCGLPVRVYLEEGISQFIFFEGDPCDEPYDKKNNGQPGKYQGQQGTQLPLV